MSNHIITLFKVQKSRASTYVSHDCSSYFFYCVEPTVPCGHTGGVQDQKIGDHSCGLGCPVQNTCLRPDRAEAYIGLSSKGVDPLLLLRWDKTPPNLLCVYDVNHIDTPAQINALKNLFPASQLNHIMRAFCVHQVARNCPAGMRYCSRIKSKNEGGLLCREWMNTLSSNTERDSVKREYCLYNNTDDCKCINRTKNEDFKQLKLDGTTLASAHCWYKPCEDNDNLLLEEENKAICTAQVCQSIINAQARGNIDISKNLSSLNCNFSKEDRERANLPPPEVSIFDSISTWVEDNTYTAAIVGSIIILVVIIGVIMLIANRKKK